MTIVDISIANLLYLGISLCNQPLFFKSIRHHYNPSVILSRLPDAHSKKVEQMRDFRR